MRSRVVLALIGGLSAVALALAQLAGASAGPAGGRVYTLLATSELPSGPGLLRGSISFVAAGSDGTLVVGDGDGDLWRLRPRVARPERFAPRLHHVTAIAVAPDGSVVAAVPGRIVRGRPSGAFSRLPMAPRLRYVAALAVARDGSILLADNSGLVDRSVAVSRILRLAPDGRVVSSVDAPLTGTSLSIFDDVAPLPGGGFAAVANGRIWSFAADGATTGPWRGEAFRIDAAPDGTLVEGGDAAGPEGMYAVVRRRAPDGRVLERLGGPASDDVLDRYDLVGYDGFAAGAYPLDFTEDIAALPHGGIAVVDGVSRLVFAAPARSRRLAVALMPLSGRASAAGYVASVRSTRPATAHLTVLSPAGRTIAAAHARVPAGVGRVTLSRPLVPGPYVLRVEVAGRDGQRAVDYAGAVLGGALPTRYAVSLQEPSGCVSNADARRADPESCVPVEYVAQRRYGPGRVDVAWRVGDGCTVTAARLGRDGLVRQGGYDCAGPGARAFGSTPHQPDYWGFTGPPQGF